jgi:hypothetical protein
MQKIYPHLISEHSITCITLPFVLPLALLSTSECPHRCGWESRKGMGVAWDLSLAIVLCFMPNAVLVVVKGTVVSGASALAEKPCDFCKSRIVLVDKDRMDFYS